MTKTDTRGKSEGSRRGMHRGVVFVVQLHEVNLAVGDWGARLRIRSLSNSTRQKEHQHDMGFRDMLHICQEMNVGTWRHAHLIEWARNWYAPSPALITPLARRLSMLLFRCMQVTSSGKEAKSSSQKLLRLLFIEGG